MVNGCLLDSQTSLFPAFQRHQLLIYQDVDLLIVCIFNGKEAVTRINLNLLVISNQVSFSVPKFDAKNEVKLDVDALVNGCLLDSQTSLFPAFQGYRLVIYQDVNFLIVYQVLLFSIVLAKFVI